MKTIMRNGTAFPDKSPVDGSFDTREEAYACLQRYRYPGSDRGWKVYDAETGQELCQNCGGTGQVDSPLDWGWSGMDSVTGKLSCPTCKGSMHFLSDIFTKGGS